MSQSHGGGSQEGMENGLGPEQMGIWGQQKMGENLKKELWEAGKCKSKDKGTVKGGHPTRGSFGFRERQQETGRCRYAES